MDYLRAMAIFIRVADGGSLSSAGRALGLSLASVSREIAGLERHLGNKLLTRTTRSVALTEHGQIFYVKAKSIIDAVKEAERAVQPPAVEIGGRLRVSAPALLGRHLLAPILPDYLLRFPKLQID